MNARQPTPLAHVPTGITIPWTPELDALYPESERGPWNDVTVEVGRRYGRLVAQLVENGPWFELYDLPADSAAAIESGERAAYTSHRDRTERERDRAAREDAFGAEWEWRAEYRHARGL